MINTKYTNISITLSTLLIVGIVLVNGFFVDVPFGEWHTVWADRDFSNAINYSNYAPNFGPALNVGGATPGPAYIFILSKLLLISNSLETQFIIAFSFLMAALLFLSLIFYNLFGVFFASIFLIVFTLNSDFSTIAYYLYNPLYALIISVFGFSFFLKGVLNNRGLYLGISVFLTAIAAQIHLSYLVLIPFLIMAPLICRFQLSKSCYFAAVVGVILAYLPFLIQDFGNGWPVIYRLIDETQFVREIGWTPADQFYNQYWLKPRFLRMLFDVCYGGISYVSSNIITSYLITGGMFALVVLVISQTFISTIMRHIYQFKPMVQGEHSRLFLLMIVIQIGFVLILTSTDSLAKGRHFAPLLVPSSITISIAVYSFQNYLRNRNFTWNLFGSVMSVWLIVGLYFNALYFRTAETGFAADPVDHHRVVSIANALHQYKLAGEKSPKGVMGLVYDPLKLEYKIPTVPLIGSFYARRDALYEYNKGNGPCLAVVPRVDKEFLDEQLLKVDFSLKNISNISLVKYEGSFGQETIYSFHVDGVNCPDNNHNRWVILPLDQPILDLSTEIPKKGVLPLEMNENSLNFLVRLIPNNPLFVHISIYQIDGKILANFNSRLIRTFISLYSRSLEISGFRIEIVSKTGETYLLPFSNGPLKKKHIWLQPTINTPDAPLRLLEIKSANLIVKKFQIQPTSGRPEHVKDYKNILHKLIETP